MSGQSAVPGVFIYGANHAVAQNFPPYDLNAPTAQAPVGSVVIVYLTGGGPVQGGSTLVNGQGHAERLVSGDGNV